MLADAEGGHNRIPDSLGRMDPRRALTHAMGGLTYVVPMLFSCREVAVSYSHCPRLTASNRLT